MNKILLSVLLAATAVLMIVGGVKAALDEASPYVAHGPSMGDKVEALIAQVPQMPPSARSDTTVLVDCFDAIHSNQGLALTSELRQRLLDNCQKFAQSVVAQIPTHSYAWFIEALIAGENGDQQAFNTAIVRSQAASPWLEWVAQARFDLAESRLPWLDAAAQAAHQHDAQALAVTALGVRDLAHRYNDAADFRTWIVPIVEQLPTADQQRFLAAVTQAKDEPALPLPEAPVTQ